LSPAQLLRIYVTASSSFFGNAFAQNWWKHERDYGEWGDSLTQLIEAAVLKTDPSANQNRIIKLQRTSQK